MAWSMVRRAARRSSGALGWSRALRSGRRTAVVDLGVENRELLAVWGQGIAVVARHAVDQAVEA